MTHEDVVSLLPSYALGALDDVTELEAHLNHCDRCSAQLASYLEATSRLGAAVAPASPPAALRESILRARTAEISPISRRVSAPLRPFNGYTLATIAALLLIALGLGGWAFSQKQQLEATRSELALDQRGLALLTSTETSVERLQPVPPLGGEAHGHWYHRTGVSTQVLVIEFMPAPPAGQSYVGWLRQSDGSWRQVGRFALDSQGYGRIILVGDDGSKVRAVVVTRQSEGSLVPTGAVVLRWPAP